MAEKVPAKIIEWREEDGELWEYRRELVGFATCIRCGQPVALWDETDEWIEGDDGRWHHNGASLACGDCCGLFYVDYWEGTFALDPSQKSEVAEEELDEWYDADEELDPDQLDLDEEWEWNGIEDCPSPRFNPNAPADAPF